MKKQTVFLIYINRQCDTFFVHDLIKIVSTKELAIEYLKSKKNSFYDYYYKEQIVDK